MTIQELNELAARRDAEVEWTDAFTREAAKAKAGATREAIRAYARRELGRVCLEFGHEWMNEPLVEQDDAVLNDPLYEGMLWRRCVQCGERGMLGSLRPQMASSPLFRDVPLIIPPAGVERDG